MWHKHKEREKEFPGHREPPTAPPDTRQMTRIHSDTYINNTVNMGRTAAVDSEARFRGGSHAPSLLVCKLTSNHSMLEARAHLA